MTPQDRPSSPKAESHPSFTNLSEFRGRSDTAIQHRSPRRKNPGGLCRFNPLLSRVTNGGAKGFGSDQFAINCTSNLVVSAIRTDLTEHAADILSHSVTANTERAYRSDLAHCQNWGGTLPATPTLVSAYIGNFANTPAVATILRSIGALSKAHTTADLPNRCQTEIVRARLRHQRRTSWGVLPENPPADWPRVRRHAGQIHPRGGVIQWKRGRSLL